MGRSQRRKGHDFERLVARLLRPIWPDAARGWQSRDGGSEPDVDGTMYRVECKRRSKIAVMRWWDKAAAEAKQAKDDNRPPLLILREDNGPIMVLQPLDDWLEWVKAGEVNQ